MKGSQQHVNQPPVPVCCLPGDSFVFFVFSCFVGFVIFFHVTFVLFWCNDVTVGSGKGAVQEGEDGPQKKEVSGKC